MLSYLKGDGKIPIPRNENRKSANERSSSEIDRQIAANNVASSLAKVLSLLPLAVVASDEHDEEFATLGISAKDYMDALSRHEVQVLGCALYQDKRGGSLTYGDILKLTDKFNDGHTMVVTMIYKTLEKLVDRGLLIKLDELDADDNRSRTYKIQQQGKEAFRMAVLNSRILSGSPSPAAA